MDLDTFKPTFLIQIEGITLSKDITQEITAFSFTDNEEELDVLELCVTNRNLQFVDDPLFQEGNELKRAGGYVGNLSPRKKAVIKDIDYGVDPSPNMLALAAARGSLTHEAKAEALAFAPESFDGVLMALTHCFVADASQPVDVRYSPVATPAVRLSPALAR